MNHSIFGAASVFALCLSIGSNAFAQSAATQSPDPVAPPATPLPAPATPADSTTVPTETSPGAFPTTTIPMGEDAHADVVRHTWPNRPMLVTGVVVLGGTYAASAIVGAASNRVADNKLFLPVVGPWLDLKNRDCDVNACPNKTLNNTLLIGDGALQGIGALTMLFSLVIPESTKKPWYLIGNEKLSVTPQVGTATTGLSAFGHF